MADYEYIYENITQDVDEALTVEGQIPAGVRGTFFVIGGTGNAVGEHALHTFDAHGRVTAVKIGDGEPRLRARMVDSPLWKDESASGHITKRRLFHNKPGRWSNLFDIDLANNAWHNIVPWGDDVIATNDPGFFRLDPHSLETLGFAPIRPAKGATFTPMVRVDPKTGHHVLWEKRPGMKETLVVREIDDGFETRREHSWQLPRGGTFLHDIGFSERYYLVVQLGSIAALPALWGARPIGDAIRFDPVNTPRVYVLPRDGGGLIDVPLPGGRLCFHQWNAFDDGDDVVLDTIGYDGRVDFSSGYPPATREALGIPLVPAPKANNVRYRINPQTGRASGESLTEGFAEAPEINPAYRGRRYRFGYAPTQGSRGDESDPGNYAFAHALARHDFDDRGVVTWDAGPRAFISPVSFVPGAGDAEDDGWLIAWIQDAAARTSAVGIFDAKNVAAGPVARLMADRMIGMISHVAFGRASSAG